MEKRYFLFINSGENLFINLFSNIISSYSHTLNKIHVKIEEIGTNVLTLTNILFQRAYLLCDRCYQ